MGTEKCPNMSGDSNLNNGPVIHPPHIDTAQFHRTLPRRLYTSENHTQPYNNTLYHSYSRHHLLCDIYTKVVVSEGSWLAFHL